MLHQRNAVQGSTEVSTVLDQAGGPQPPPAPGEVARVRTSLELYAALLLQFSSSTQVALSTARHASVGKGGSSAAASPCICTSLRWETRCSKKLSKWSSTATQWLMSPCSSTQGSRP